MTNLFSSGQKYTPEQRAQIELCGDLKDPMPDADEVFDHYGEKITFAELVERFRNKYGKDATTD